MHCVSRTQAMSEKLKTVLSKSIKKVGRGHEPLYLSKSSWDGRCLLLRNVVSTWSLEARGCVGARSAVRFSLALMSSNANKSIVYGEKGCTGTSVSQHCVPIFSHH